MEFPYAVNHVLSKNATVDVVICLGVVVKGETRHFEVILDSVTQGLVATSLKFNIPIINEVLFVDSIDEAQRRSANDEYNKGIEAAVAAIEILNWSRAL